MFPCRRGTSIVFGSTLLFRFTMLHLRTRPVLVNIPHGYPRCYRTCQLLGFVGCFIPMRSGRVPPASLLHRFLKKDDFGCWTRGLKCVHSLYFLYGGAGGPFIMIGRKGAGVGGV